ncbi:MAG: fasciclin domain-containing protein [Candidatus Hydrogenedentes bacterium]|nr:fasciclin domain-containing protein [Candidatus Hydrogenedentota bacterium]
MKIAGFKVFGVALCVALAAILSWGALPTSAEGDACPLAAKAAKADGAACDAKAKTASLAKDEKSGECCEDGAKPAVAKSGDKAELSLAADAKGECPLAAAAALKTAEAKGECPLAAAAAAKVAKGECAEGECDGKTNDIAKLVMTDSRFTTLALAAKAAGMTAAFACPNQKTVFAPTNEAFQKIPAEQWAILLQDDAKLKAVLANHIVTENAIQACQIKEAKSAKASGGCDLAISACPQSGTVSVNGAKVVGEALVASNGVVHVIDTVLVPADMQLAKSADADAVQVAAAE